MASPTCAALKRNGYRAEGNEYDRWNAIILTRIEGHSAEAIKVALWPMKFIESVSDDIETLYRVNERQRRERVEHIDSATIKIGGATYIRCKICGNYVPQEALYNPKVPAHNVCNRCVADAERERMI